MKLLQSTIIGTILFCLCLLPLVFKPTPVLGAEIKPEMKLHGAKVITIRSDEFDLRTLTVDSGTTVVWINTTSQRQIELEFTGKEVVMACGAPVGFFVNEKGSYSSGKISPGSTASLCFIEKGEYNYEVELKNLAPFGGKAATSKTFKGKVIVK
jgi:plastocyanin